MEHTNLKRKKIIKLTVVFLMVILGFTVLSKTIYELLLPQVTTTKVSDGCVENTVFATGQIGQDALMIKSKKVVVKTYESGIMTKCFVEEGQKVAKGEPLFTITLEEDYKERAQEDYNRLEIEVNLEAIQKQLADKTDKKVELEKKLSEKREEMSYNKKSYEMIELESQIKNKKDEMLLNQQLLEIGGVSESTYKKSEEELFLLMKKKEQLQAEEEKKEEEVLSELEEKLESLESEIDTLRQKQVLEDKKLDTMVGLGKEIIVESPISGTIYELNLAEGVQAGKGEVALAIVPKDIAITLTLKVDQQLSDKIKMEQEITWTLNRKKHQATVVKKTYDIEKDQMIITCKLSDEDIRSLELGNKTYKTVDINIGSSSEQYDLLVDNGALVKEGKETYVYTIKEQQKPFEVKYFVDKVPVYVIYEGDMVSAVSGQLSSNQEIIRTTSKPLRDGMEVNKN